MGDVILVIEDDQDLVELLRRRFLAEGYHIISAFDGVQGLELLRKQHPNLIILDLMMPRMDGWETCRRIREISDLPIIVLTALGQDLQKVRAFELGADDYVTKPFSFTELSARIRAALRRYRYPSTAKVMVEVDERLTIDRTCARVIVDGETATLSPTEFRLINCFLDHANRILTSQSLLTQVWGWEYAEETDYLKVYVHRLRAKIEEDPGNPRYILTERGLGYRFQMLHTH